MTRISGLFHCFTQLCLCLHFWQSPRCFIVLGHFDSITARFFGVLAVRYHLFCFCFMNKYDSRSLKCLFLSTSPIAPSRVYNCLEYDKFASVLFCFIFYMCASHVLWALRLKSIKLSNCQQHKSNICYCFLLN